MGYNQGDLRTTKVYNMNYKQCIFNNIARERRCLLLREHKKSVHDERS